MVDMGSGSLTTIASNPGQNAFVVCGQADRLLTIDQQFGLLTTTSSWVTGNRQDIVVAKINAADGTVLWGRQIGGAGDQLCQSATIDNNGDVIIAGNYNDTLDSAADASLGSLGSAFIYVAKLSGADGSYMAAQAGAPPAAPTSMPFRSMRAITSCWRVISREPWTLATTPTATT